MLAETSNTDTSKKKRQLTSDDNKDIALRGGSVAGISIKELEKETGKPVITSMNTIDFEKYKSDA